VIKNQRGYALMESLVGLALLGILSATFLETAPLLLGARERLDAQQSAYNQLFEIRSQNISQGIFGHSCLSYSWRGIYEEICL